MTRNISKTATTATIDLFEELVVDNVGCGAEIGEFYVKLIVQLQKEQLERKSQVSFENLIIILRKQVLLTMSLEREKLYSLKD